MTTTHTPGPWFVDATEYVDIGAPAGRVAMLDSDALDSSAIAANAALIAAAPELLAALRSLVTALEGMAVHPSHYAQAREAIARAIGTDA